MSFSIGGNGAEQAILKFMSATHNWLTKDDILTRSGVPANQWQLTINQPCLSGCHPHGLGV
jgi:hypothetical protein